MLGKFVAGGFKYSLGPQLFLIGEVVRKSGIAIVPRGTITC
jgi:hypothetical protein